VLCDALERLVAGDWAAFPPVEDCMFFMNTPFSMQAWDSPPAEGQDHKPQGIEMMAWWAREGMQNKYGISKLTAWWNRVHGFQDIKVDNFDISSWSSRHWITVCR